MIEFDAQSDDPTHRDSLGSDSSNCDSEHIYGFDLL